LCFSNRLLCHRPISAGISLLYIKLSKTYPNFSHQSKLLIFVQNPSISRFKYRPVPSKTESSVQSHFLHSGQLYPIEVMPTPKRAFLASSVPEPPPAHLDYETAPLVPSASAARPHSMPPSSTTPGQSAASVPNSHYPATTA